MSLLVPVMLFGWVPLTVLLFFRIKPHHAALVCVIGGMLFLPMTGYSFSGFPDYSKETAIALGLILGGRLSGKGQEFPLKIQLYDMLMIAWCLCPIASSLTNNLGIYDGLSSSLAQSLKWGVPYFAGRKYFCDKESLKDLLLALLIGGLLYAPLCLYEVRMSPQLSNIIYGFFPHSWVQHLRYGGYRPIVFMQHGLMVSLWIAIAATAALWCWRSQLITNVKGIPTSALFILLTITCFFCKSANGFFAFTVGCVLLKQPKLIYLTLLSIPCYLVLRMNNVITIDDLTTFTHQYLDTERVDSLAIRLLQEDLFYQRALEQPFFGWGGYDRGKPIDPHTGQPIKIMIDSLWIITMRSRGFVGLITLFSAMLIGPWLWLQKVRKYKKDDPENDFLPQVLLSLIVVLFMIDSLLNGMINSVYILISGALLGTYLKSDRLMPEPKE
ncbi:hypothetical protein [Desulfogranum mediterraneum]|uniref:hypothetical protein n=1 Tax=Desulfogranum mediterraneum TaxID=160661 RepID=UPI00041271A2|nr:hypothetical protein [Desulfogranum mediterraneum]